MRKFWLFAFATIALGATVLSAWDLYEILIIHKTLNDMQWGQVQAELNRQDQITPDVGSIQFIKGDSFSIELEKVSYKEDGIYLKGYVGNDTQMDINNLGLRLIASKNSYDMRPDYDKSDAKDAFASFMFPTIGIAQAEPIPILLHGTRAEFETTIPNVKQTKDGIRIEVLFTGERYSYPGG